jgi:putative redox protein
MDREITISFPGNRKVDASYKGFTIKTDQSIASGGDGTAPAPFDLFLASIGTCAGIYVVDFLTHRGISLENVRVVQTMKRDPETHMISAVTLRIELPKDFPDKYKDSLIRAVDLCAVKKHIMNPPAFAIETVKAE